MITVHDELDTATCTALQRFEKSFQYPLDSARTFHISHGADYLRFFRKMGDVTCFIARGGAEVQGVLTTVRRRLLVPGLPDSVPMFYLCDLKVAPGQHRGMIFLRLAREAQRFHQDNNANNLAMAAFGVVMDGSARTPDAYTGSLGIPRFQQLAEIAIFHIPTNSPTISGATVSLLSMVASTFERLSAGSICAPVSFSRAGSRFDPVGLVSSDGQACGVLEDTLVSKRLFCGDVELVSAHLSSLAFADATSGRAIVDQALLICRERKIPDLFLAIPRQRLAELRNFDVYPGATLTGAKIYGLGLPLGLQWNINTSEV